ncbi:type II secretion system F family protein [Pararhodobacter sp.]|uniref:type II secretion system F family protein n=1 Tax=Pararhodobacter sp. TaxID=2127056 RepID=UPI002AFE6036|nr:type II secretion system F family protein [Pararhodobacter sp.]
MNLLAAIFMALAFTTAVAALFYRQLFEVPAFTSRVSDLHDQAAKVRPDLDQIRNTIMAERMKELAQAERARKSISLKQLIQQAGYKWTPRQYTIGSIVLGLLVFIVVLVMSGNLLVAIPAGAVAGYFLPRHYLRGSCDKRKSKFVSQLPDALDAIARSRRAGVPMSEAIKVIVRDGQEPLRSEFQILSEDQAIGATLPEAMERLAARIPVEEMQLLSLAVSIQNDEGGGIAKTLTTLSNTIRERAKLTGKIKAMMAEAKSGSRIMAGLPVAGIGVNYLINPDAASLLWTTLIGQIVLGGSAIWVAIGLFVMSRMQRIKT